MTEGKRKIKINLKMRMFNLKNKKNYNQLNSVVSIYFLWKLIEYISQENEPIKKIKNK